MPRFNGSPAAFRRIFFRHERCPLTRFHDRRPRRTMSPRASGRACRDPCRPWPGKKGLNRYGFAGSPSARQDRASSARRRTRFPKIARPGRYSSARVGADWTGAELCRLVCLTSGPTEQVSGFATEDLASRTLGSDSVPGIGVPLFFGIGLAAVAGQRCSPRPWGQCRKRGDGFQCHVAPRDCPIVVLFQR